MNGINEEPNKWGDLLTDLKDSTEKENVTFSPRMTHRFKCIFPSKFSKNIYGETSSTTYVKGRQLKYLTEY